MMLSLVSFRTAIVAVDKENAIDLIKNLVQTPDIFLVNQVYSLEEYLAMIRDIYQQHMLPNNTPTVLIVEQHFDNLKGIQELNSNIFVFFLEENPQQLFNLLHRLLNSEQ